MIQSSHRVCLERFGVATMMRWGFWGYVREEWQSLEDPRSEIPFVWPATPLGRDLNLNVPGLFHAERVDG